MTFEPMAKSGNPDRGVGDAEVEGLVKSLSSALRAQSW